MARTKQLLHAYGKSGVGEYRVTETFTHRQTLDDGTVLLGDPERNFWKSPMGSWYGVPPKEWDMLKAIAAHHSYSYVTELDYS